MRTTIGRVPVLIAAVATSVCILAGCSTSSSGSASKDSSEDFYSDFKPPTVPPEKGVDEKVDTSKYKLADTSHVVIGYADSSLSNSWRVMTKADTEYGIAQIPGAKMVYTNADDDASKQIADMDDLITQGVDAIILSATDVKALCPSIQKAAAAGIPVVLQERAVDCDGYVTWVSMTTMENAMYGMSYIAQRMGGKGELAIIGGFPGVGHTTQTLAGYKEVLKDYPDIKVVATEYGEYDPAKSRELASAILTAHPDVEAFAGMGGLMEIGAFEAVKDAGKLDQMKGWLGDDFNGWMKIHSENNLPSMTVPAPTLVGRTAVEMAFKILSGETVPRTYQVPKWADPLKFSENIDDYADPSRPDEWWYTDLPCDADPFCKS